MMLALFIEFTNQIFWDGYAHELSVENPEVFRFTLDEFVKSYNHQRVSILKESGRTSLLSLSKFKGMA